jgi:predicted lipoprotein with Yx(FWY)xxD motif
MPQQLKRSAIAVLSSAVALAVLAPLACHAGTAPLPTNPQGITLVEVMRELPISQPEILWVRIGDANGRTVFTRDDAKCDAECAKEFPPLLAARGAKAFGDWSLLRQPGGQHQWAYQKQPLYTWSKEQVPGEVATNVGLTETANAKLAETPVEAGSLLPPPGWQVARFNPAAAMSLPDGVDVRIVSSVQAVALTDAQGFTLYALDGDPKKDQQSCIASGCDARWMAVAAPALAAGFGDFSVVTRADGSAQWAYKKRALYRYSNDRLPGDAYGVGVDTRWSVAVITENFRPADIGIATLEGYGDALALKGMTLYGGYSFEKRWGGRNLRDTFTNAYYKGKQLGAAACIDPSCLERWRPFIAPADAQPNGFWEPVQRPDGSKQWAYKGYALYTYAGDSAPGQHNGQATYDFVQIEGDGFDFKRVSLLQEISKASGGVGVYWNIAKP